MPARIKKTRVCVFLFVACQCAGLALAEDLPEKEPIEDQAREGGVRPKPILEIEYQSVFDDIYVPFDELPDIGWIEANDNVGKIGGWRTYARWVQEEARKKAQRDEQKNGDDQQ